MVRKKKGMMFVLSSPSGTGKTTLTKKIAENNKNFTISISHTTRKPRPNEINGKDYYFVSKQEFKNLLKKDNFFEHAAIFDNWYGTSRKPVLELLSLGKDVLFDIDWQGTQALREMEPKHLVSVFILPPSTEELEKRLQSRGQDTLEEVSKRMAEANSEITHWAEYDYIIINNDIEKTLEKLKAILISERLRRVRQVGLIDFVRKVLN